ncbi:single-stranded dna-binding protein : Single-stranded DNA-binding protein OS=Phycisphaera mikurensis (strain NBRC 102666 / KCTC 22515 / FYK2301M01) GN=ssb PE=4 SV=1: SSB [Gemmata massiliana]|uniref:Single-stranded DNA-binding protein n=1 Tax=Gemmata massiliana TaxID=1210884 RepID=A0A6P2CVU3_9BACT|nr:single-stranded DNA-binding protein [Gemmata massiliana]VTR91222.1 single-stranded dna-binding protein : Single-stranded DNA-binding protein OS=Phycisphaera mikurensis (strain NBRC 102666 / KCTC 22515 / FYK2301M01) GN=ssb PE=4 SV=1: SSB [Gemmata massiliana]
MANLNKVILIGRLTGDPKSTPFKTGGMVAKFGFAVTNRKKNSQSGQWEDDPMFIDVEVFNRGDTGKLADLVMDKLKKGSQVMLEAKLHLDQWDDKNGGGKRSKHKLVVDNLQLLDPRSEGGGGGGGYGGRSSGSGSSGGRSGGSAPPDDGDDYGGDGGNSGGGNDPIPF